MNNLCEIDRQVHEREPYIGHLDFRSTVVTEKSKDYEVIEGITFSGFPVTIRIQKDIVTNIEIN